MARRAPPPAEGFGKSGRSWVVVVVGGDGKTNEDHIQRQYSPGRSRMRCMHTPHTLGLKGADSPRPPHRSKHGRIVAAAGDVVHYVGARQHRPLRHAAVERVDGQRDLPQVLALPQRAGMVEGWVSLSEAVKRPRPEGRAALARGGAESRRKPCRPVPSARLPRGGPKKTKSSSFPPDFLPTAVEHAPDDGNHARLLLLLGHGVRPRARGLAADVE